MLHVALAAFLALTQQHFMSSGFGGVIAAVVGGVIAAVVARANKRSAPAPAPAPQPAPDRERHAPSGGYGQPAPPTSPARRLHAGPIVFTEPTPPQQEDDSATSPSIPPTPDAPSSSGAPASAPIIRSNDRLTADWREREAAPLFQPHSTLWNRKPFARPESTDLGAAPSDEQEPPIWSTWLHAPTSDAPSAESPAEEPAPQSDAPIWPSYLRPEE